MARNYRDSYYGSILDPLHGDIKLSEIEKWILAQPIFSRLRYVKQNTFLYYVFPSANHTRFEHSIGVMHMASRIFDACKENYATGEMKRKKYSQKKESFFNISNLNESEPLYYQELRLAALLHDVGHGPMSHLFDNFSISIEGFLKIIEKSPTHKKYLKGFTKLVEDEKKVEHETLSCVFIIDLIQSLQNVSEKDPNKFSAPTHALVRTLSAERIVKMISPKFEGLQSVLKDANDNNYEKFFSKIVTAFPIDADRMDYLIRDSYFSGVTYGIYDLNRIYSSFQAIRKNRKVDLVFKESGLDSLLRFIQSRSHLYNQVYFHKTNRAVNTMLTYATESIRRASKKLLDKCNSIEDLKNFYIIQSDEVFVKQTISEKLKGEEKKVLTELINRKLFKRVFEKKIVMIEKGTALRFKKKRLRSITDAMSKKLRNLEKKGIYSTVDYYENDTFKDAGIKNISLAKKTVTKEYEFITDWSSVSKDFEMSDMTVCMIRVYVRRTFHSSTDYEHISEVILRLVGQEIKKLKAFD